MGLEIELKLGWKLSLTRVQTWNRTVLEQNWAWLGLVRGGWGPVCRGLPLTSQYCVWQRRLWLQHRGYL